MWLTEDDMNRLYYDEEAWELAYNFYGEDNNNWFPIICAGRIPNCQTIFFITKGSADYHYDVYSVDEEIIEEYGDIYSATENGYYLYEYFYVDHLEEVVNQFRLPDSIYASL